MPKKGRKATRTTPGFTGPFKGNAQQGTLFDVGTLPKTGNEIGPRGYSLNRSRQFNDIIQEKPGFSMKPGQISFGMKYRAMDPGEYYPPQGANTRMNTAPAVEPDEHPFGPAHLGVPPGLPPGEIDRPREEHPKSLRRGRSKLIDTLARSTVDPKQLEGLGGISINPAHPDAAGIYTPRRQSAAGANIKLMVTRDSGESSYGGREKGEPLTSEDYPPHVKQGQQRGPVDPDSEQTLLHEIGHHVSFSAESASSRYSTGEEQGAEEAKADAFSMKHFRQDPRSVRWLGRHDPREHSYVARGNLGRFGPNGMIEYLRHIGGSKNLPHPSSSLGRTLEESSEVERHERPMLDEPRVEEHRAGWRTGGDSGEVFKDYVKGFGGGFGGTGKWGDSERQSIYRKAAQTTNMRLARSAPGGSKQQNREIKQRFGVNRKLGRQFGQPDEPTTP